MTLTGTGGVRLEPATPAWQVLADGRAAVVAARPPSLGRTVVSVLCASALALVCLLLVASYAGRRAAESVPSRASLRTGAL